MTKEVSEAAGRLRVYADPVRCCEYKDLRLVVDAYLALIPADDGEPIDETWLRDVGFENEGSGFFIESEALSIKLDPDFGAFSLFQEDDWIVPNIAAKTRGDLRRLAKCLSIPLKEQPHGG